MIKVMSFIYYSALGRYRASVRRQRKEGADIHALYISKGDVMVWIST